MEQLYSINPELDIPIYQQLVDSITAAVKKGVLGAQQQLPTVQELSEKLNVARGTVKRAYDELEHIGIVEKVQGRGTFVCYMPPDSGSRKERAMALIDNMLNQMEEMGLSAAEVNIFLNLKLRDRAEQEARVKVAVLECNPENLTHMAEQLHSIPGIELYSHLLDSIRQYPYKLGDDMELVVTTAAHGDFVQSLLNPDQRMARIALRLTPDCLSRVIKLRKGRVVGVMGYSVRFAQLLYSTCETYNDGITLRQPLIFSQEEQLEEYLRSIDTLLLPDQYEKYCSAGVAQQLERFEGQLIRCSYEMDDGSYLFLQEKVKRLLDDKTI